MVQRCYRNGPRYHRQHDVIKTVQLEPWEKRHVHSCCTRCGRGFGGFEVARPNKKHLRKRNPLSRAGFVGQAAKTTLEVGHLHWDGGTSGRPRRHRAATANRQLKLQTSLPTLSEPDQFARQASGNDSRRRRRHRQFGTRSHSHSTVVQRFVTRASLDPREKRRPSLVSSAIQH